MDIIKRKIKKEDKRIETKKPQLCQLGRVFDSEDLPLVVKSSYRRKNGKVASGIKKAALKEEIVREELPKIVKKEIKKEEPQNIAWEKVGNEESQTISQLKSKTSDRYEFYFDTDAAKKRILKASFKPDFSLFEKLISRVNFKSEIKSLKKRISKADFNSNVDFVAKVNPSQHLSGLRDLISNLAIKKFAVFGVMALVIVSGANYVKNGLEIKATVLGASDVAYENLDEAVSGLKDKQFALSFQKFDEAYSSFEAASNEVDNIGVFLTKMSYYFPYLSQLSTGKNLLEVGKSVSLAGKDFSSIAEKIYEIKENGNYGEVSIIDLFESVQGDLMSARENIRIAKEKFDKVKIDDVPEDKRLEVADAKEKVELASEVLENFLNNSDIMVDLLGGRGPRKYLFLFQNNNEMRPTGGFIGSYGLADINDGKIRNFFIDGIFNPDGQMVDRVVPPVPIQKMSINWSLHDSNWFPNFPTSAQKSIVFYEKTGGPTVDGVIAFTPVVLQRLLEITGPIYMEEYDIVIDSNNFIEKVQYEVEIDYDKEENNPKKILADLAPIILDKLINSEDVSVVLKTLDVFSELAKQKHILVYSSNSDLQKVLSEMDWSGEIKESKRDYLSVINTNINGFKTDGVIDETIKHTAKISNDGSVVNMVEVSRRHNGGNTDYEWWNKVNADYMRIYVPKGSKLLSVEGQTRENNEELVTYDALGFERDADVVWEEEHMTIDTGSGTRIYEENEKTVFANWVYVSPQEEVTIKYKYLLPFKVESSSEEDLDDVYAILVQKQSGSKGSELISRIKYPTEWNIGHKSELLGRVGNYLQYDGNLMTDVTYDIEFEKD